MDTKQHQTQAAPPSPRGRRSKTSLGWGPLVLAGVALVTVIAAAIWAVVPGGGASSRSESRPAPNTAATATEEPGVAFGRTISLWDPNTGDVRLVFSARGKLDDAELSPDGERVVYERQIADGSWQIYLLEPDGTERPLTALAGGGADPAWHPNGRSIAFAGAPREGSDADIFTISVDGGSVRRIGGTPKADGNPDWSPDGTRIVFDSRSGDLRGEIWVTSVGGHALHQLAPRRSGDNGAIEPAWSPDGRWIAYQTYQRHFSTRGKPLASTVRLMRPDGSDVYGIGRIDRYELWQQPSWSPDGRTLAIGRAFESLLLVDPATGRRHVVRGGSGAPSWGTDGILMTPWLPGDVPTPVPAPPAFQAVQGIEAPGIDATITMTRTSCELRGGDGPIRPDGLKLEFVNETRFAAYFTLRRLARERTTLSELRAKPPGFRFGRPQLRSLEPSSARVWSRPREIRPGRWAVLCHKVEIPGPGGSIVHVGVAGPIRIG